SKDEQLTFYLKEYPNYPGNYTGTLTVLFGSEAGGVCGSDLGGRTTPAIEVTYLTGANPNEVKREIIEPCGQGTFRIGGTGHVSASAIPETIDNVTYNYQATISGFSGYEVLFMRSLFATTRMVIQGSASFPRQGKWIQSEAYSLSGPSKIVKVFQSLPQVTADFVVTTF
ncbi:MAG: hypothetical protein O3B47_04110, partial [bacterium]|nr:hypothetical protein [bacterium]